MRSEASLAKIRIYKRTYAQQRRASDRANGLCQRCRKAPHQVGCSRCTGCLRKQALLKAAAAPKRPDPSKPWTYPTPMVLAAFTTARGGVRCILPGLTPRQHQVARRRLRAEGWTCTRSNGKTPATWHPPRRLIDVFPPTPSIWGSSPLIRRTA